MNLRDHDDDGAGKKVWLSQDDVARLLEAASTKERRVAFALGVRCGLRSKEVLNVSPQDVAQTDSGPVLRVWEGKGDKFRETPIPESLADTIDTVDEWREESSDEPVLSISTTRSLRRWLKDTATELAEETDDPGWRYLSTHDLRRTWATALSDTEVDALMVLDWGGWEDLETFLDHYKGAYSPAAQRRAREQVAWL